MNGKSDGQQAQPELAESLSLGPFLGQMERGGPFIPFTLRVTFKPGLPIACPTH